MSKRKRLYLIDGTALAYRSHFAFIRNPLTDSSGRQTGATFGFVQSLNRLLEVESPDSLAMIFDASGPTFRHEVYSEYKATRQKMDEGLVEQIPLIYDIVDAFRIPRLEVKGYEADDVIATLAVGAEQAGLDCTIVSGDKDFAQLVTSHIRLYQPSRTGGEAAILGRKEVEEKYGVPPEKIVDLLALMGDSSDNVPGVPKVGAKTAVKLLTEWGDLDATLANADSMKAKSVRENLLEYGDQARLSKELVTLCSEVPLDLSISDFGRADPDRTILNEIFTRLEFHSLVAEVEKNAESDDHTWLCVGNRKEFEALLARLSKASRFVFDLETTDLDPLRCDILGFAFSLRAGEAFFVPLGADPPILAEASEAEPGEASCVGGQAVLFEDEAKPVSGGGLRDRELLLEALRPILEDPAIGKSGQNIKYDLLALSRVGIRLKGVDFDTMIASYLIEPGLRLHNLDVLARRFLGYRTISIEDLIGKGKGKISMADVPLQALAEYACEDADLTLRVEEVCRPKLHELELAPLFDEIEMPLIGVLAEMEQIGVRLDVEILEGMSGSLADKIERLQSEVFEICGEEFNVASPKQLGEVLFDRLEIHKETKRRKPRKTKTGYSTDSRTLERFADHPAVEKVLEFRTLSKLKSTYVDALPLLVHPETGRLHTSYNQAVAATGRLSSSDPNLQNIPIRTPLGRQIRKAFLSGGEDRVLLSADYSQIELRIMAHLSGDSSLIDSFQRGEDVHTRTAATIFGVEPEKVDLEMRSKAKAVNFGIMYGMGPHRLASDTGIAVAEAQAFILAYFESFPGIKAFLDQSLEQARETGVVRTLLGRLRLIPEIHSSDGRVRSNAENMAVNTPIQGSAADMIKKAMVSLHRRLESEKLEARMILQVHDELVLDVPRSEVEKVTTVVREEMEGALVLEVPVVVDVATGENWFEAHA